MVDDSAYVYFGIDNLRINLFPSGVPELDGLLGGGYPDKSVVLVLGVTGVNKEMLGLRFADAGLSLGDFCVYVTRLSVNDVKLEATVNGLLREKSPFWITTEGGDIKLDMDDFANLSFNIKNLLKMNASRRIRIVLDSLSPLLMLSQPATVHRFLSQLFSDVKQYDAVLLGIMDESMHERQVLASMEDLFDGVISLGLAKAETGESPTISVKKMRGVRLLQGSSASLISSGEAGPSEKDTRSLRLVVLPMTNLSPDSEDEYFSDGMTEELISVISNVSGLNVISRTSSMKFKGAKKTIAEISNELKVGTVLEGSVRKTGNRIRITVQLVDASEDRHLWTQSYDRELKDVFAVQSDVASKVAEALKVKLLDSERIQIHKSPTENTEAYLLYLKGRQYWNRRFEADVRKALEYFQLAAESDPSFALAFVGIADCWYILLNWGYLTPSEAGPKGRQAVLKALELDSTLAEAHATYAVVLAFQDWKWEEAESEFKRAIELNPNYASAHQWYSHFLRIARRLDEELQEASKALELDPLAPVMSFNMGQTLYDREQYDKAIEHLQKALAIDPNFLVAYLWQASCYTATSRHDKAIELYEKYLPKVSTATEVKLVLVQAYGMAGRMEDAKRLFAEVEEAGDKNEKTAPIEFALAYLGLGEFDRMFECFEKAALDKREDTLYLMVSPILKRFRSDPRFITLKTKIGI